MLQLVQKHVAPLPFAGLQQSDYITICLASGRIFKQFTLGNLFYVPEITKGEKGRMGGVATHLARVAVDGRRCGHRHSISEDDHQEKVRAVKV
jgi:hypothetical protein